MKQAFLLISIALSVNTVSLFVAVLALTTSTRKGAK